jgi:Tfp pilus assembly protein PilF
MSNAESNTSQRGRRRAWSISLMTACVAFPLALLACGDRKPAKTATTATTGGGKSTGGGTSTAPGGGDNGEAPPPPPAPGESTKLVGAARDAYDRGVASYNAGDLPGAYTAFSQAVSSEPKAYEAHYALAMTAERMGKNGDALEHYREAYKLNPNYDAAITAYGFLLYKQGNKAEAETFLSDQQAKNNKSVGLMTALAEIKSLQGDSVAAQKLASDALTAEAKYEPAMVLIARDHYRRGRLDLASYVLTAILDGQKTTEEREKNLPAKTNPPRAPNNAEAHYLRAVIYQKQGERLAAAKWFESAGKLRPDLVEARLQLGLIRLEANDAEGALEPLQKAVAYASSNVEAHLALGEAYRLAGSKANDAKAQYNFVLGSPAAAAQLKALAQYDLGLLYFLTPGIDGLTDPQRMDKAVDYFDKFKAAKGSASGPSWPADADDLKEQAFRAKSAAAAAGGGAGGTTPKPATTTTTSAKASAAPTTSAKPATAPTPTTTTTAKPTAAPTTTTTAKPTAAPTTTTKPSGGPAAPKTTF